ncbi:CDP-alcohol phosphatidyltransferase family protein [Schaalia cardiffensis]
MSTPCENAETASQPQVEPTLNPAAPSASEKIAAWAVHAFTMSGLAWAMLAAIALVEGEIKWMWFWLLISLIVDGVDGTLARHFRVKEVVPWFDGGVLDNVVDYITWTFLPGLFMYLYLPFGSKTIGLLAAVVAVVSSVFCYANAGEKSNDAYFVGFPAAWNVVALAMYLLHTPVWFNIAATIILAVLTLVPLHYTHPMRVRRYRMVNLIATGTWIGAVAVLVWMHPFTPVWALVVFWVSAAWFLLSGVFRTIRGRDDE